MSIIKKRIQTDIKYQKIASCKIFTLAKYSKPDRDFLHFFL